jgi:hypothetical protein
MLKGIQGKWKQFKISNLQMWILNTKMKATFESNSRHHIIWKENLGPKEF